MAGCPRSGTSALSWAIASHPQYWTSVETHFFYYLLRDKFLGDVYSQCAEHGSWLDIHDVSHKEYMRFIGLGFNALLRSRSGGAQWVDGSPENLLVGEQILEVFPEALIINVVRHPEKVCISMLNSGFAEAWASDIDVAVTTWCHYAEVGLALLSAYPDRVIGIKQEDMLHNPGHVAETLRKRLRLADASQIEAFLTTRRINSSFSALSYVERSRYKATTAQQPSIQLIDTQSTEILGRVSACMAALGY